jgi:hypothetical protein
MVMGADEIENDLELQRILWACYKYWQDESLPPHERTICYSWVIGPYEDKFDTKFHQSKLQRLAKLGFLKQDETSRGGGRRYYKIINPEEIDALLRKCSLN